MRQLKYSQATLSLLVVGLLWSCSSETSSVGENETAPVWEIEQSEDPNPAPIVERAPAPRQLQPGDRFPLKKTVVEELVQDSLSGPKSQIKTRLEQLFTISVTDRIGERTKLAVTFDRIQYTQQVGDEITTYDSLTPPADIPEELLPHHLLANDGFSFWIGSDLQVVSADSFQEFLARRAQSVTASQIQTARFESTPVADQADLATAISQFIGMQPIAPTVHTGDQWQRIESLDRPVLLSVNNRYTVQSVNAQSVEVAVLGSIAPFAVPVVGDEQSDVRVVVTGGEVVGSYTLLANSGIPQQSHVEELIQMRVQMSNALEFNQIKRTTTNIDTAPAMDRSAIARLPLAGDGSPFGLKK